MNVRSKPVRWILPLDVRTSFTTFDFVVYGAGSVVPQNVFVSDPFISNVSKQNHLSANE